MTVETPRRPRAWVFWMVVAALALTALALICVPRQDTDNLSFWLMFGMPQVSVALLAALLCWAPDSRPRGFRLSLGITVLNLQGLMFLLYQLKWQPAIIGAITIIVLKFWPKEKVIIEQATPEQTTPGRVQG